MPFPIGPNEFYDFFPSTDHLPGDIWSGFPTFGLVTAEGGSAIIVTPACDLSNRKVETVTYLPVVPVAEYLTSRRLFPEIQRIVSGQLEGAGVTGERSLPGGYSTIHPAELAAARIQADEVFSSSGSNPKRREAAGRALAGLDLLDENGVVLPTSIRVQRLRMLMGSKAYDDVVSKLVTNGHRLDVHFLPRDNQRLEWSGVREHSLALFRFPMTLPIEVLDVAQQTSENDWEATASQLSRNVPSASHCIRYPLKRLRLKTDFASDMLTRFTAMFNRLGSPDFTPDTVAQYVSDIRGEE